MKIRIFFGLLYLLEPEIFQNLVFHYIQDFYLKTGTLYGGT